MESLHAVYPITPAIAQRGGALRGQFQAQSIARSARSAPDMLIAATAIEEFYTEGASIQENQARLVDGDRVAEETFFYDPAKRRATRSPM